ncbi:hypothetical protein N018_03260 [Pseudomonas syringae CC1557]|uniref:Uncharacterized protein n=1 Tax=Pseudomonas syringae CC1557 TaxID=1357279 RepID=W0N202_PSESX|nr:hypothetical protein N018_03260 [Pseudomonas syringae CC1557]
MVSGSEETINLEVFQFEIPTFSTESTQSCLWQKKKTADSCRAVQVFFLASSGGSMVLIDCRKYLFENRDQ